MPNLPLELVWASELPATPASAAAADTARIFVPLDDGTLVALDRSTGRRAWSRAIASRWPPLRLADALFVTAADGLHELDPATGATRRTIGLPGPPSAPAGYGDGFFAVTLESGVLRGVHRGGDLAWEVPLGSPAERPPGVGPGAVFVALGDGRIVAFARDDGRRLWWRSIDGELTAPLAAGDRVFVGSTDDKLYAFDAASGVLEWSWQAGNDVTGVAVDEDRVFLVSQDNMIRALDRDSGNLEWQRATGTRPTSAPFHAGDRVFLAGLRPPLIAFEAASGTHLESFALPEPYAPLLLAGPLIVLPQDDSSPVQLAAVARNGVVVGLRRAAVKEEKKEENENENEAQPSA